MNRHPIVAGVDGSPESIHAAVIASRVARDFETECVFVYALPMLWTPDGVAESSAAPELVDRLVAHVSQRLAAAGLEDAVLVRPGKAGVVLNHVARERHAGLIVVGGRHHGALSRGLGGSTAHHLVRTADAPVLIVDSSVKAFEHVLAAVDLYDAGGMTLRVAARYAAQLDARLRAVHVVEPAKYPGVIPLSLDQTEYERRCREEFARLIEAVLPNLPVDDRIVRRGVADEEIAEEAAVWGADLLVIGSHGKGWIDRLLIGSTTERLLNRLPASLLVVPIGRPARSKRRPSRSRRAAGKALV